MSASTERTPVAEALELERWRGLTRPWYWKSGVYCKDNPISIEATYWPDRSNCLLRLRREEQCVVCPPVNGVSFVPALPQKKNWSSKSCRTGVYDGIRRSLLELVSSRIQAVDVALHDSNLVISFFDEECLIHGIQPVRGHITMVLQALQGNKVSPITALEFLKNLKRIWIPRPGLPPNLQHARLGL